MEKGEERERVVLENYVIYFLKKEDIFKKWKQFSLLVEQVNLKKRKRVCVRLVWKGGFVLNYE